MKERSLQGDFTWGGQTVFRCQVHYPQLEPGEMPGCEGAVSAFYSRYAKEKWNRLAAAWSPKARANCQRLKPYGLFEPLEAQCEYTVMYCQNGYCSVFFDTYFRQGAQELDRGRQSCTFWAPAGMVPLAAFFRPGCAYRAVLLRNIREQIARQCVQEPKAYYVDWPELVSRRLDERNYYLADDGFVLYYPRRALGPSITGIPSFLVPYGAFGSGLGPEL